MLIAIDWDATLVDTETQEWLPGALNAVRQLRRQGHRLIIHSARARSQWGEDQIRSKLGPMLADIQIEAKPKADIYLDNQGLRFNGDWSAAVREVRQLGAA